MKITHKSLWRRIVNVSFAFVVALGTVSTSTSLYLAESANALPVGQTQLRLSSAAPAAIAPGAVTSFSVKQVGGLGGDAWTNILTSFWSAKIEATVPQGQVYNCAHPSMNVVTIAAGLKVVEGTFCYKGMLSGTHTIHLKSTIPQVDVTIVNHADVDVTVSPLGVPTNLTPVNGTLTNDRGFSMGWDKVAGATKYEYQTSHSKVTSTQLGSLVYQDNTYDPQYVNYNLSGTTVVRGNSNTPDGDYYWQVRAGDDYGNWSEWSQVSLVTVDGTAPSKPVVSAKAGSTDLINNGYTNDYSIKALWNTPAGTPLKYDYRYWNDIAANAYNGQANAWYSNGLTGNELDVVFNQGEGKHYFQVRAIDAANNPSDWSDAFAITYDKTAPEVAFSSPVFNGNEITPVVTATDTNAPLTYAWTGSNPNVILSATDVATPTFTASQTGTYSYDLTVTDAAGNATTKTFTFGYTLPVIQSPVNLLTSFSTASPLRQSAVTFADDAEVLGASTQKESTSGSSDVLASSTKPEVKNSTTVVSGLAWYWWVLIIAAIAGLGWLLFGAYRRRQGEEA